MFRWAFLFVLISTPNVMADFSAGIPLWVDRSRNLFGYGTYTSDGNRGGANSNFGFLGETNLREASEGRNVFSVNLSPYMDFIGDATSVELVLTLLEHRSPDSTETFHLFQYSEQHATIEEMLSGPRPPDEATRMLIFEDLGSGPKYATTTVSESDLGTELRISFSLQGVADFNSAIGGIFAFGMTMQGPPSGSQIEFIGFGVDSPVVGELRVTSASQEDLPSPTQVPEPSSAILAFMGIAGLGLIRRRRRKLS